MSFSCLTCASTEGTRTLAKGELELWTCARCHLVQLHPPPSLEDCVEDYEDASGFGDESLTIESSVHERDLGVLRGLAERGASGPLLDVGAGAGILVRAAREMGLEVEALELATGSARRIREEQGVTVHTQPIESAPLSDGHYGIVTFSHSLEHVPSPANALRRAHALLRDGGVVHVAVPNWGSGKRKVAGAAMPWIYPGHVSYFTRATLRAHLEAAGFEVREMTSRPFLGPDYRFVIALLRRLGLDGPLRRFLHLGERPLESLLTNDLQVDCPIWRIRAVIRFANVLLKLWPERMLCWVGQGEELRATGWKRKGS